MTIDFCAMKDADELFGLFGDWDRSHSFDYEVFVESLRRILLDKKNTLLVVKENDLLVGYAQMYRCDELGFEAFIEVAELLVSEEKRNLGIGKLLIKRVEEIALADGISVIKLSSQVHRTKSHMFYENLGFEYYKISKFYEKKIGGKP